jgi:threonine/homoserine/homoserine lactone efflux protein
VADRPSFAEACCRADAGDIAFAHLRAGRADQYPESALFFLAFLPQFVDPEGAHRLAAFLMLGTVFNTTGLLWNLFVAWSSAGIGQRFNGIPVRMDALHRIAGAVFVILGVKLALTVRQAS